MKVILVDKIFICFSSGFFAVRQIGRGAVQSKNNGERENICGGANKLTTTTNI
jgi:hypothetical protein